MTGILAWINVSLLLFQLLPWVLKQMVRNRWIQPGDRYRRVLRAVRIMHRPAGLLMVLIGITHGYLATGGNVRLNLTGTLVWLVLLATVAAGGVHALTKQRNWLRLHRAMVLGLLTVLIWHYNFRGALF